MTLQAAQVAPEAIDQFVDRRGRLSRAGSTVRHFIRTQPVGSVAILVIIAIAVLAAFAPYWNTVSPHEFGRDLLFPPGGDHWLGTNRTGQDMWSRVIFGGRPALLIGAGAVGLSLVIGTALALLAGFLGGLADTIISRAIEIAFSLPTLIWLLILTTLLGRSLEIIVLVIGVSSSPAVARIIRGNVIQERHSMYVEAAQVVGASSTRIMFRHILPNLAPLVIIVGSALVPAAILAEAGLTFLGLGLEPGSASWGIDLGLDARSYFKRAWWLLIFPGIALSTTVLAFNLFGDAMRDVLDPRLRGSGLV